MNEYVADSMALILRLEKRKMPKKVRKIFVQAENKETKIFIPSMVFAELGKELAIPVMTNDPIIRKSKNVQCIWE